MVSAATFAGTDQPAGWQFSAVGDAVVETGSQDAKKLLKKLIFATIPIYGVSETINLFVLCFERILDQVSLVYAS